MLFIDDIYEQLGAMLHPSNTIKSRSTGEALKYYYMVTLIPLLITLAIIAFFGSALTGILSAFQMGSLSTLTTASTLIAIGIAVLFLWVVEPVMLLIDAAILQVIGGNLFKSFKGRFSDTLSALVYASCAVTLFIWLIFIPFVGIVIISVLGIWSLILQIIGLAKLQKISRLSAFAIIIGVGILIGIIADVLVFGLAAMFSLGVFSTGGTSSFASTTCIPSSGYYCTISSYPHGGNILATIGQSTGTKWGAWAYYFCSGCSIGMQGPIGTYTTEPSMPSGGVKSVVLATPARTSDAVGTVVAGTIWVCYTNATYITSTCTSGSNSVNFVQIATLTAKST
jgi:hypothetical protein